VDAGWIAVLARVGLVGAERVFLKQLGAAGGTAAATFLFFAVGALALLPFALAGGPADPGYLRLALPSAAVYSLAFLCYVSALSEGEVSVVGPLGSANAVFVVLLAAVVHDEPLPWQNLLGTALIVGGAAALQGGSAALARPGVLLRSRPARRMLAYALLLAATRMFDKAGATAAPPALYALTVFVGISVLVGLGLWRAGRLWEVAACAQAAPGPALAAGLCNGGSFLGLIVALARLPVSVVEPLTAVSLLVSALLAGLWLHEPIRTRWLPTLAVVAGSWLLLGGAA
jgi:transporter family protein